MSATGVISDIIDAVAAKPEDTLVEIGPGLGALTVPLANTGAELHAIEFDRDLAAPLRKKFASFDNVTVHECDALTFDYATLGDDLRIVSNLPYNISTPMLFRLIEYPRSVEAWTGIGLIRPSMTRSGVLRGIDHPTGARIEKCGQGAYEVVGICPWNL